MTASGGFTASAVSALLGGVLRLDVVSRPAQARPQRAQDLRLVIDDEQKRGSCPHRLPLPPSRVRARSVRRPGRPASRDGRRSLRRSHARSRGRFPSPVRRPRRASPRRNGWKTESRSAGESPGRGRRRGSAARSTVLGAHDDRRAGRRELERVSIRFASARSICAASTRTGGASAESSTITRSAPSRTPSSACPTSSSTGHRPRCGSAAPASIRERSSRSATTRSRRWASLADAPGERAAVVVVEGRARRWRGAPAEARIAVSGERRSCETGAQQRRS